MRTAAVLHGLLTNVAMATLAQITGSVRLQRALIITRGNKSFMRVPKVAHVQVLEMTP